MTGRAAGYCAGYTVPGYASAVGGRQWAAGWFGGRGRGNRHRHWFYATGLPRWMRWGAAAPVTPAPQTVAPQQEIDALKQHAESLKQQLQWIDERLSALTDQPETTQE